MKIIFLLTVSAILLAAYPSFAEEAVSISADGTHGSELETEEEVRYYPTVLSHLHLGVGSAYQLGLGLERTSPAHLIPFGYLAHGLGFEVMSEWQRDGFQNIAVLGRVRGLAAYYMPAIWGAELLAGAAMIGDRVRGVGGFSIHASGIAFDFGYRYQRVFAPLSSSENFGRHFFFFRLGFSVKED